MLFAPPNVDSSCASHFGLQLSSNGLDSLDAVTRHAFNANIPPSRARFAFALFVYRASWLRQTHSAAGDASRPRQNLFLRHRGSRGSRQAHGTRSPRSSFGISSRIRGAVVAHLVRLGGIQIWNDRRAPPRKVRRGSPYLELAAKASS